MWNSNGDIISKTVEVVDPGDMHVSGRIDGNSNVMLRSTGGSITVDGKIDGSSVVSLVTSGGSITVGGKVDGSATVVMVSTSGAVTIAGRQRGHQNRREQFGGISRHIEMQDLPPVVADDEKAVLMPRAA